MTRNKIVNSTKLTLDHIIKEVEKYNELTPITIDGVGYTEVYRYFSPQKIEALFVDLSAFIHEYQQILGQMTEKQVLDYLNLFIILHFSTLVEAIPQSFSEKIVVFEKILNSEIAEAVAESFDKKEITKIMRILMKKLEMIQQLSTSIPAPEEG